MAQVLTAGIQVKKTVTIKSKRIDVIDVLRGFALFGILVVHSYHAFLFLNPGYSGPAKNLLESLVNNFVSAKFYPIFSFLFGLGFAIQIKSAETKGVAFAGRYLWRLTILLLIGLLHSLLFSGDVLKIYACLGSLLLLTSKWSNPKIVCASVLFFVAGIIVSLKKELITITVNQFFKADIIDLLPSDIYMQVFGGRLFTTASLFMLGLYAGRKKIFVDSAENLLLFKRLFISSVAAIVLLSCISALLNKSGFFESSSLATTAIVLSALRKVLTSLLYVSAIVVLYNISSFRQILNALSPIGKLGMSTYIVQSFFLLLFYTVYLKSAMAGTMSIEMAMGITVLFFAGQMIFARWWLSKFKMGPMEWVWRSLTYFEWQPIKK